MKAAILLVLVFVALIGYALHSVVKAGAAWEAFFYAL